ncbi:hypothetical protein BDV26DRAFT_105296 [Aspergillus bertholletiae]|uniref:Uncharacterized protein n=1 Tax=Aspergillus bertholletiae TaxID=1226010 RepID=A0A5N7AQS8_9EURO|nr:hypothetical protein BDV26DRAFT_105296 [Aspergillus bertholletiae]
MLRVDYTVQSQRYQLQCNMDYVLWYRYRADLDLNLVIITKKSFRGNREAAPLASMALIHHLRKAAGLDAQLYGAYTDSQYFDFYHVNNDGQCSRKTLKRGKPQAIDAFRILFKIYRKAHRLSRQAGPTARPMAELINGLTEQTTWKPIADLLTIRSAEELL